MFEYKTNEEAGAQVKDTIFCLIFFLQEKESNIVLYICKEYISVVLSSKLHSTCVVQCSTQSASSVVQSNKVQCSEEQYSKV